jgi:ascorbate-specific PTS system EIIC-type component UlaA
LPLILWLIGLFLSSLITLFFSTAATTLCARHIGGAD